MCIRDRVGSDFHQQPATFDNADSCHGCLDVHVIDTFVNKVAPLINMNFFINHRNVSVGFDLLLIMCVLFSLFLPLILNVLETK